MGNNTSAPTIRKSSAGVRKSSAGGPNHENLEEEFNDMVLHEVKQESQPQFQLHQVANAQNIHKNPIIPIGSDASDANMITRERSQSGTYKQFSNGLIEDEFNELNDGLLETDVTEVSRNILPNNDSNNNSSSGGYSDEDKMEVEPDQPQHPATKSNYVHNHQFHSQPFLSDDSTPEPLNANYNSDNTPTPDLSKVDFTKIAAPPAVMNSSYGLARYPPSQSNSVDMVQDAKTIPVEIKWVNTTREDIQKISIIGSFSNWRDVIKLKPSLDHSNEFVTTIKLPLGVHKLLYIINNEYRVSEQLPTATDQEGIFFNWFEVLDHQHLFNHSHNQPNHVGALSDYDANIIQVAGKQTVDNIQQKSNNFLAKVSKETPDFEHIEYPMDEDMIHEDTPNSFNTPENQASSMNFTESQTQRSDNKYVPYNENLSTSFLNSVEPTPKPTYSNDIPEMFLNYDYFKQKGPDIELPEPPQLPAHLNNVLLNKISNNQNQNHAQNVPQLSSPKLQNGHHNHHHHHHSHDGFKPPILTHNSSDFGSSTSGGSSKRPALRRADSSYYASNKEAYHLSIPNHVILNHLMTTSIRNDVLTVACITRYSGKFVTQIMHSPADP